VPFYKGWKLPLLLERVKENYFLFSLILTFSLKGEGTDS
jgi:hypothetical protein